MRKIPVEAQRRRRLLAGLAALLLIPAIALGVMRLLFFSRSAGEDAGVGEEAQLSAIHKAPLTDIRHLEDLLRRERISCLVAGDEKTCAKGCCPTTFYLLVRREDARDAVGVIQAVHAQHTALHHHDTSHSEAVFNADVGEATCPACGHKFPTAFTTCPDCGLCFG